VLQGMRAAGLDDVPLVVGGIVPEADAKLLVAQGVAAVFTPKDYGLTEIVAALVAQIRSARGLSSLDELEVSPAGA